MEINVNNNEDAPNIFDNVTKENLSTYLNKCISDTVYILQLQINSFLSNNLNYINPIKNNNKEENININDKINLIKKINNSLEKELLCLNKSKTKDISKIIQVLIQRNELLNKLMNYFFDKQKLIENKELYLNRKMKKLIDINNSNNRIDRTYFDLIEHPKINLYIENIKKNNEYNYKNLTHYLNNDDEEIYYNINPIKNISLEYIKEPNAKKKLKRNFNRSYGNYSSSNLSINKENIYIKSNTNKKPNINNENINIKSIGGKKSNINNNNLENKKLKAKSNSVSKISNNDYLIEKISKNRKFNMKNIYQIKKLNLEKLSDISSSLLIKKAQK